MNLYIKVSLVEKLDGLEGKRVCESGSLCTDSPVTCYRRQHHERSKVWAD